MRPLRILTVVGARPQFIKAAMVSRAIVNHSREYPGSQIIEEIVHTGQHYDDNMSGVFFREMGIPAPTVRLDCGGKSHGAMTGQMLDAIEKEIVSRKPDWVLVYGDTNSTLAGALAAAKLFVPVAHVEAGLRSFNRRMPEEINRILTDHVSSVLFCPTKTAVENLNAERTSSILSTLHLMPKSYYLATVHRQENTDIPVRLMAIFEAFNEIATQERPVVVPLHPRTRLQLLRNSLAWPVDGMKDAGTDQPVLRTQNKHVCLVPAVSFLDMIMLEKSARTILTDSGGVQKEAYWHRVPCITLRDETEWIETVETGWNCIAGADTDRIVTIIAQKDAILSNHPALFGEGDAARCVCNVLVDGRINEENGQLQITCLGKSP
jgi:UDP-GlcNAc3NAcA epimerase